MSVVPDASVVVKWYVPERDHERARDLRDGYLDGDCDLLAPALMPFEVLNALRYSGFYEGDRLAAATESLDGYRIDLRSLAGSGDVAGVAASLGVSVYDASYVALAAAVDGEAYTADEALVSAVSGTQYASRVTHVREYS